MQPLRARPIALLAVALAAALVVAFRAPLWRALVAGIVDVMSGSQVAFSEMHLSAGSFELDHLEVRHGGEPLLAAERVVIRYDSGAFFRGARRLGLESLLLERPQLFIVRRRDGSFNLPLGGGPGPGGETNAPNVAPPMRLDAEVRDGQAVVIDPGRVDPAARRIALEHLSLHARIDSAGRSSYAASARYEGKSLRLKGSVDAVRGYALHRLQADEVPIATVLNYIINLRSAYVHAGVLRALDVRAYGFGGGAFGEHLTGSARLSGGVMDIPGLRVPLRDVEAPLDLYDDGVLSPRIAASEAGVPVLAAGGIYDWHAPEFRLGMRARGPLQTFRTVFRFSRELPLSGSAAVAGLVEGPVGDPLVIVRVSAAHAAYGKFPIDDAHGSLAYRDSSLALYDANARYGPIEGSLRGSLDLGDRAVSQLVVDGSAPPGTLPYLAQAVPATPVQATALLSGNDLAIDARGVVAGQARDESVRGLFRVDNQGDGEFGPFGLRQGPAASLAGAFYLNRIASESGFWFDAHGVRLSRSVPPRRLPGLPYLAPPDLGGTLDATLAGEGRPSRFGLAGYVHARGLVVGNYAIGDASGQLLGSPRDLRVSNVAASGPWGNFRGSGAYDPGGLALLGNYRGSFAQLETFTGNLGASGPLAGPVALLLESGRTIVQTRGAQSSAGSVRGVPLEGVAGTFGIAGQRLRVYAASARLAGGSLAAAGTLGGRGRLGVALADLDASRLHVAGLPAARGSVAALGSAGYENQTVRFDGGVALANARVDRFALAANGNVHLNGTRLDVQAGQATVNGAYGTADGEIGGIGTTSLRYDVGLHVRDAPLAPFARQVLPQRRDIAGTLSADLRVSGSGQRPAVAGTLALPEGSFQGQPFRDARVALGIGPDGIWARDGSITVGSTVAAFEAGARPRHVSLRLEAPHADLSDFDDLFDTGDTLAGRGSIATRFTQDGRTIATSADLSMADLRYLRFALGDSQLVWSSRGRTVRGGGHFGGASGQFAVAGTLVVPPSAPFERLLQRSAFNGTASVRGLDLSTWMPLLGYSLPLSGHVDADANLGGNLQAPDISLKASLNDGTFGKIPIQRAVVSATSSLQRLTLTSAEVDLPSLVATGSGTVGLGPHGGLALSLHAKTDDLGALATRLTGARLAASGAAEADAKVVGSRELPHISGGFYAENATLQAVAIPRALGQFVLEGRNVVLQSGEVAFGKGVLYLAGSLPFTFSPFAFGPPSAPVEFELSAKDIDLTDFAPLLPKDSSLQGLLAGRVGVSGSAGAPHVAGDLALAHGALTTPFERQPLTNIAGELHFSGDSVDLRRLHAEAGGGTLDATGGGTLGMGARYRVEVVAKHLQLDLPAYGRGQIDGTASLVRNPPEVPQLSANLKLQDTVIPFSALFLASGVTEGPLALSGPLQSANATPARPEVALSLDVAALNNVRVRSANVDIGGTGALHVGGTSNAPKLSGQFVSTGGTLSYFNTVFRIQSGVVTFEPDLGLVPTLTAVATTHVANPDPNAIRNFSGTADVTIDVSGPVTNLNIALSSSPPYDRDQILGLLLGAPMLGATNLFDQGGYPSGTLNRNSNGEVTIAQQAFGVLNAQFTRNLLSPFETQAAGALGLSNLNLNVDYTGAVGVSARKVLGKQVSAIYASTFGYPSRQSFGFEIKPNANTVAQLTLFTTVGASNLSIAVPAIQFNSTNYRITAAQPSGGESGFSFSLQLLR